LRPTFLPLNCTKHPRSHNGTEIGYILSLIAFVAFNAATATSPYFEIPREFGKAHSKLRRDDREYRGKGQSSSMMLYHFTHPNYFPSIMRDGLVPSDLRLSNQSIDRACVWLFDTPESRDYMDDRYRCLI
jgi:hypothetical protein